MNLTKWDLILVNSSGGKDSTAALTVVVEAARAQGVLDRVHVVHCDLGERVEWDGVRDLVGEHAAAYGLPFHVVRRRQGDLLDQVLARGMWPSSTTRFCTSDHKRDQVGPLITRLVRALPKLGRRPRVLQVMGHRADESPARAKLPAFGRDARNTNGRRLVCTWRPIHAWTLLDVWARIKSRGLRSHHAYALGMGRLSCCFCVFAPKGQLVLAGRHNPAKLDAYVAVEAATGHSFTKRLRIAEVKAAIQAGEHGAAGETWCM